MKFSDRILAKLDQMLDEAYEERHHRDSSGRMEGMRQVCAISKLLLEASGEMGNQGEVPDKTIQEIVGQLGQDTVEQKDKALQQPKLRALPSLGGDTQEQFPKSASVRGRGRRQELRDGEGAAAPRPGTQ